MTQKRTSYTSEFKTRVALAAIKGDKTLSQLSSEFDVSSVQISQWKKQALEGMSTSFERGHKVGKEADEAEKNRLYQEIGKLKIELDWLKKKSGLICR
jgi:transposase